eukprot:SAG31_NODE_547_length_14228_cov_3.787105_3_plen_153_part_00
MTRILVRPHSKQVLFTVLGIKSVPAFFAGPLPRDSTCFALHKQPGEDGKIDRAYYIDRHTEKPPADHAVTHDAHAEAPHTSGGLTEQYREVRFCCTMEELLPQQKNYHEKLLHHRRYAQTDWESFLSCSCIWESIRFFTSRLTCGLKARLMN